MKALFTFFMCTGLVFACNISTQAQGLVPGASDYYELALLFSQYDYKGTARMQGLGGAQISLGGDISSALSNPAGLGFYNRSEVSLTPSVNNYKINSNYLNNGVNSSQSKFNIEQFGAAFHKKYNTESGFISGTFGITFTKVNEFNNRFNISGSNTLNDILDHFTQNANQIDMDDWPLFTEMAWDVYLIDEFQDPETNEFFYDRTVPEYPSQEFPVEQSDQIISSGSQNQWSFSYGANFKDILYLGAGIGIQSLRYDIEKDYRENYVPGSVLMSMNLYEELSIRGTGINGTFGFIARPIQQLTIGGSVITPTLLSVSESSLIYMESNFDNLDYDGEVLNQVNNEQFFEFDYQITTPVRLNAGATFFISKYGFLTADIEYVDYSNSKLDSQTDPFDDQNRIINSQYKDVLNYRFGAEGRLDKFRMRVGYSLTKSPYVEEASNYNVSKFSAGLGFRNSTFFTDVVASYSSGKSNYYPYTFASESNSDLQEIYVTPVADLDYNNLNVAFSLGFFF